jgi:hypothetical protein
MIAFWKYKGRRKINIAKRIGDMTLQAAKEEGQKPSVPARKKRSRSEMESLLAVIAIEF